MRAALPWYDFDEVRDRTAELWRHLRQQLLSQGLPAPENIERGACPYELLTIPDLLVSQICGYVVGGVGSGLVQVLGVPTYTAPGCGPGSYRSFIVVPVRSSVSRLEDLRGARCVANEALSHSGVNAMRELAQPLARDGAFFAEVRLTGSHVTSMVEVAEQRADVAAIDCIAFALLARYRPALTEQVRVVITTATAPAPPLVTAGVAEPRLVRLVQAALQGLVADEGAAAACRELFWGGFGPADLGGYEAMAWGGGRALGAGYRDFAFEEVLPNARGGDRRGGCAAPN